ncbi:MAG: hypothetical protein LBK56_04805 [Gracilibacteraceae bacterium]|jgi:hypothetical protein|nr:hypothetical protein [Gracilibacteraceae bacterium]
MRAIHIANAKKRDAEVGLEALAKRPGVRFVLPDGGQQRNVKILRSVTGLETLTQIYGGLRELGEAIIAGDPEVDREQVGKFLRKTHKLYLNHAGQVAYRVNLLQVVRNPDGTEKERRDLMKAQANVTAEIPIQWSGRKFPKDEAIRRFVFTRQYQIRHTNGLSYDFLYAMAKELQEAGALMFVGAGKKGSEPIVITTGGEPYRGFLEGRVDGDRYCLILHLTNLELKPLVSEE